MHHKQKRESKQETKSCAPNNQRHAYPYHLQGRRVKGSDPSKEIHRFVMPKKKDGGAVTHLESYVREKFSQPQLMNFQRPIPQVPLGLVGTQLGPFTY